MTELNGCKPMKIKVLGPYTFKIGDTKSFAAYAKGGICTQVKMPTDVTFKPLKESLENPDPEAMLITDFGKWDRPGVLHIAFQAMHHYKKEFGSFPKPWCTEDAAKFVAKAKELNQASKSPIAELDEKILERLPEDKSGLTQEKCAPAGTRYDGQVAVFGKDFQEKMIKQKYFVVGAGAIGCELLKNFAMVGLGSSPDGKMIVTDMDIIERSNLNRQFLFRPYDVQKPKSSAAAKAIKAMN